MAKITEPRCSKKKFTKNNFKSIRNEYKEIFSSKKNLICLYNDILNQNLSISEIAIYHLLRPSWPAKKSISRNSLVKYSPICLESVKKIM